MGIDINNLIVEAKYTQQNTCKVVLFVINFSYYVLIYDGVSILVALLEKYTGYNK